MSKRFREKGQFLNFFMQYMMPSELDIHTSLYQQFLCLILFWCSCIATGEKEVCTGKMTLLESVKMCVHRRSPACLPRRGSQLQAGCSNAKVIFPCECQAAAQTASPVLSLDCNSLHLQVRITGASRWSWESCAPGGPHSSGNGGYKSVERRLLWSLALICLKLKGWLLSPVFPITLQELKIYFEEGFKQFFPPQICLRLFTVDSRGMTWISLHILKPKYISPN